MPTVCRPVYNVAGFTGVYLRIDGHRIIALLPVDGEERAANTAC